MPYTYLKKTEVFSEDQKTPLGVYYDIVIAPKKPNNYIPYCELSNNQVFLIDRFCKCDFNLNFFKGEHYVYQKSHNFIGRLISVKF